MKKIMLMLAAGMLALVSCDKDNGSTQKPTEPTELDAPVVTVTEGTGSLTANWAPVKGANGYRCEITYVSGGRTMDVLKTDIEETTISVEALKPKTTYTVRIAATRNGKASPNWFSEEKKIGEFNVTFDITPYEVYNSSTGHIDYLAKVKPSSTDVYYWTGAVTYAKRQDAKIWIESEISDALQSGATWEDLVADGYIAKGNAESVFAFTGEDIFMFSAAILAHLGNEIVVVSTPTLSYPFHAENFENKISHPSNYKDYIGDWVVMPYDVTVYKNGQWGTEDAKTFEVKISEKENGKSFNLTGWGGSSNKFANSPIVLDFAAATSDKYEHFNISFPQDITTEGGVQWAYTTWFSLTQTDEEGNEKVTAYDPYDYDYDKMATEQVSPQTNGWKQGFRGYVANANKTVIKILPNTFKYEGLTAYMQSIWVCGMKDGKYSNSLNNDKGGQPNGVYYLVRKDIAEGMELPAPDVTSQLVSSVNTYNCGRSEIKRVR